MVLTLGPNNLNFHMSIFHYYLIPAHANSSRVWIMQESPVVSNITNPLRSGIIPQDMCLIDGVSCLPQSISQADARTCTWFNGLAEIASHYFISYKVPLVEAGQDIKDRRVGAVVRDFMFHSLVSGPGLILDSKPSVFSTQLWVESTSKC